MTEPSQHFWNSTGLELSVLFMMLKSLTLTLPTDTPVPVPTLLELLAPQENDMMSISPLWLSFCDSPVIPSSFKKASYAMIVSLGGESERGAREDPARPFVRDGGSSPARRLDLARSTSSPG